MRSLAKLAVITAAGATGACLASPVIAATSAWEHNGSRVTLEESGEKRTITYADPKAGLKKAGVKRGTVLFDGKVKKDGRVSGYAKIFKVGCDPVDYFVEGTIDHGKGKMVLQGQAPVYSGKDCRIKGYSEDSKDSMLVFRGDGGGAYAGNQPRERDDADGDTPPQRSQRNGQQRDDAYASRRDRSDDGNDDRQYRADRRYDDRQYEDRQYDGDADGRDYARRDYDPRYDRPRRDADSEHYDGDAGADDEEYRTYRYRTYRRSYERPYQPWWRYGQ